MNRTVHSPAREITYTLCTGGFDSTYRLIELSRMEVLVQPVYCANPERESMAKEQANLERILEALRKREGTLAAFLPLEVVSVLDLPEDPDITAAAQRLAKEGLGTQYAFLARLAKRYPGIEVGIEKAAYDKKVGCRATILRYGALITENGVARLDMERSSEDLKRIVGNFSLPIIHLTEMDMLNNVKAWGYEDILSMIWFCHEPLGGKPCGMCRACEQKMDGGMEFLLPPAAQRRHHVLKACKKVAGPWLTRKGSRFVYRHLLKGVYEKG